MRITVVRDKKEEEVDMNDGATAMDVLAALDLLPDAHIVLRGSVPIPIDGVLEVGDRIRIIRVASGG
ncbi:MAG: MoaD/ThiS family protein [Methanomassiliicoccus sp.]|nr:MoaD/ThiS family protein [Methanomassiliicoccus sp.]